MRKRLNNTLRHFSRHLCLVTAVLACVVVLTACPSAPNKDFERAFLLYHLENVPVGGTADGDMFPTASDSQWANMGFERRAGDHLWHRVAKLDKRESLVPTPANLIPGVDCIAIISVDRRDYLARTLKSVFATFPKGIEVNVMVGDERDGYVSEENLSKILAPEFIPHVHVFTAPLASAEFMRTRFDTKPRAGWNASRVLRSYTGEHGLLLLEDDVEWPHGAIGAFSRTLQREQSERFTPVISLFNHFCHRVDGAPSMPPSGQPMIVRPNMDRWFYFFAQTMYYTPQLAARAGDFLLLNMNRDHYDVLLNEYYHEQNLQLGYMYPGLVQHIGGDSLVGTDRFPRSECIYSETP